MANVVNKGPNFATAEFKKGVVELVNASGLPCCITRMVLAELADEIKAIEQNQIQQEAAEWLSGQEPKIEDPAKSEKGDQK